ncbi:MAG: ribosomal protein S12 methylthiotransferase RimO [Gammaproteobacteria bacterium]|nr:MAG: ribosomal protein S12 methylthiotransferase RimO [Gammaproteobacteria bacterium]
MSAARIGFVSLGCPKALYDSECILTRLAQLGYRTAPDYAEAELVIVNTCGFIDEAKAESLQAIGEALAENGRVVVTGCLGRDAATLRERFPQVLAVTGPHAYDEVVQAVLTHLPPPEREHDPFLDLVPPQGIKLTPPHYAYLKIAEGCNHRCSFCIIPSLRGPLVSRPVEEILVEAEKLVRAGVRELLIVSQDTSAYGVDRKYRSGFWHGRPLKGDLPTLCRALGELGVWVRLHYVYPYPHVDRLVELMAEGVVLPYLDVPLQHADPDILRAMRRPAGGEDMLARIERWREVCPELVLRSTFIVGFPGEDEAHFQRLLDFLEAARLDRVGCFQYSPVEGAAANALPGAVPDAVKAERWERLMALQAEISAERLAERIGRRMTVLVDAVEDGRVVARGPGDAPEIDGQVIVEAGDPPPRSGEFLEVEITGADTYDLYARPVR